MGLSIDRVFKRIREALGCGCEGPSYRVHLEIPQERFKRFIAGDAPFAAFLRAGTGFPALERRLAEGFKGPVMLDIAAVRGPVSGRQRIVTIHDMPVPRHDGFVEPFQVRGDPMPRTLKELAAFASGLQGGAGSPPAKEVQDGSVG
jgi:hypothetical protein